MKPNPPASLWVALVALALISAVQFILGIGSNKFLPVLVAVLLNLVLLYGLWRGFRWAFVCTLAIIGVSLLFSTFGSMRYSAGQLLSILLVGLPVLLSKDYFFGAKPADPLRCPRCGYSLLGLTVPRCPECGAQFQMPG